MTRNAVTARGSDHRGPCPRAVHGGCSGRWEGAGELLHQKMPGPEAPPRQLPGTLKCLRRTGFEAKGAPRLGTPHPSGSKLNPLQLQRGHLEETLHILLRQRKQRFEIFTDDDRWCEKTGLGRGGYFLGCFSGGRFPTWMSGFYTIAVCTCARTRSKDTLPSNDKASPCSDMDVGRFRGSLLFP